jgi:superoxide dismutase, Fe-Mn family
VENMSANWWEDYKPKKFDHLIGEVKGLSEKQLTSHFTLYEGYVKKMNEIQNKLKDAPRDGANYSFNEFSELKRRESVAFNGTFLHEAYFDNMLPNQEPSADLKKEIDKGFGSLDNFHKDLKACAASTPGWVILTKDNVTGRLHNYILFEHNVAVPVQQDIILALDCWEHAFMIDYGIKKADYINAFVENLNWELINERFEHSKKLGVKLQNTRPV